MEEEALRVIDVDGISDEYLSPQMFDYCLEELRDRVVYFEETSLITVLDAEFYIAKSDTLVPDNLRQRPKDAVTLLENVSDSEKDWHLGSDGEVLDILHPSLFVARYGLTRALPVGKIPLDDCLAYISKGQTTEPYDAHRFIWEHLLYGKHQWLPSDLRWTPEGLEITSYVNNLHPHLHKDLYKVLESFAALSVPMFEQVVIRRGILFREHPLKPRFDVSHTSDEDELMNRRSKCDYWKWKDSVKMLHQLEPEQYYNRNKASMHNFRKQYPDGLQIIFKLANIHLTPGKPTYDGGAWHIEGALNEQIYATVLNYHDQDNFTDSCLAFRHQLDGDDLQKHLPLGQYSSLEKFLGIENRGPGVQNLGKVLTRGGRMLAFPNTVQHQVRSFSLADRTKPGHRKILAMFLVDPNVRVLSTSVVPPQRRDWWTEEVRKVPALGQLPAEVFGMIVGQDNEFPVEWDVALKIREELMEERSAIVDRTNAHWEEAMFSFSED